MDEIKSIKIMPNVLYMAPIDDSMILGEGIPQHFMGVFLPTPRSIMYMDIPGEVTFHEGQKTIKYITLQRFLEGLGKGNLESIILAYSMSYAEMVVYRHPLWETLIYKHLHNLVNFDLYGVSSILNKHLRHFEYTDEYIQELKHLRQEIQNFDRDDSISDIVDRINWQDYHIIKPYTVHIGEDTHGKKGIYMLGRKIQDVRVDVLIDRIDMDIGDFKNRQRELTPDTIKRIFVALYIYGHLTFYRHLSLPLPRQFKDIIDTVAKRPGTNCMRCLYMKFLIIDDIDTEDNFFYIHARSVIEAFYKEIYGITP